MQAKNASLVLLGALLPLAVQAATPDALAATAAKPAPTDAEAQAAFEAAQKAFQNTQVQADTKPGAPTHNETIEKTKQPALVGVPEVMVFSDPSREIVPGTADPKNVPIEGIRVVVDVENDSLRDIMHKVVTQAARYTGPWQVKWRLKPENMSLLDERVNLTAEARFGDFVDLLTERIKNMSGVQLFVTTFNESRIIMVADTYY